jgi:hypothetical protein
VVAAVHEGRMVDCHVGSVCVDAHEGLVLALGRFVVPRVHVGLGSEIRHEGGPGFHGGTVGEI